MGYTTKQINKRKGKNVDRTVGQCTFVHHSHKVMMKNENGEFVAHETVEK